ncbi:MAG: hypothetical protein IMF08_14750 [Proteobacteria bacterium]|nr:hypothetical protein [Pseudomonadota bacterium]
MAVAYNDTPVPHAEPRASIIAMIGGYFSLLSRSIAAANAYETLNQMSDAQLAKRGLERGEIANVARKVLLDES